MLGNIIVSEVRDYVEYNGESYPVTNFLRKPGFTGYNLVVRLPGTIDLSLNDFWDYGSLSYYAGLQTLYYINMPKPDFGSILINPYVVWDCENNDEDELGNRYVVEDEVLYSIKDEKAKAVVAGPDMGHVEIPQSVDGVPVTEIADHCFEMSEITGITIPDNLYIMGYRSLPDKFIKGFEDGYIYINKVLYKYKGQMPETFTVEEGTKGISCNLWDERFNYFDPPVKELNLPNSLIYIGDNAFRAVLDINGLILPAGFLCSPLWKSPLSGSLVLLVSVFVSGVPFPSSSSKGFLACF